MKRAFGWLSRLTRGDASEPGDSLRSLAPGESEAPTHAGSAAVAAPDARAGAPLAANDAGPSFGARRPLLAASGEVAGFEFRLADAVEQRLRRKSDAISRSAHQIALLSSMRSTLAGGRIALASMPAALLLRPAVTDQVPDRAMLIVTDLDPQSEEQRPAIDALRARGVRLGAPIGAAGAETPSPATGADFAVLSIGEGGVDALIAQAAAWRAAHPDRPIVATDLPDIDAIEKVLKQSVAFATGRIDTQGPARELKPLKAGAQRICKMLNDVVMDRDTAQIAAEIRADVGLSYRMLRYVNSPALGLSRRVESIEQAMSVLGRNELYRWLSVLLLGAGEGRRASRALQEIALARARLFELLAREAGEQPDSLFTVGLLSLLDAMLQVPLDKALAPLNLGESAHQALLERSGPWEVYLAIAAALEQHDTGAIEALAERFGGSERVLKLSEQAWVWSAEIGQTLNQAP